MGPGQLRVGARLVALLAADAGKGEVTSQLQVTCRSLHEDHNAADPWVLPRGDPRGLGRLTCGALRVPGVWPLVPGNSHTHLSTGVPSDLGMGEPRNFAVGKGTLWAPGWSAALRVGRSGQSPNLNRTRAG